MPDKPTWYGRLEEVVAGLEALSFPWVERSTLEQLLGVGRRRAQQILAPLVTRQIGRSGLVDRELLIAHLRRLAGGEAASYEAQRRQKLAGQFAAWRQDWTERPRLLVEASETVLRQNLAGLPPGIRIRSGEIRVTFETPTEALEKLLALAMAIGNDLDGFERMVVAE